MYTYELGRQLHSLINSTKLLESKDHNFSNDKL